jgi:hypothetical protein
MGLEWKIEGGHLLVWDGCEINQINSNIVSAEISDGSGGRIDITETEVAGDRDSRYSSNGNP